MASPAPRFASNEGVADAIAKSGKVGAERVFVLEPKLKPDTEAKGPAEKAKLSRVDFSLK